MGEKRIHTDTRLIPTMINKELMTMLGRSRIDEFGIQLRLF